MTAPLDLTADELTEFLAVTATEAIAVAQPDGTPDTEIKAKLQRLADAMRAYSAAAQPGPGRAIAELLAQKLDQT
jgi:hypothetical protein